MKKKIVILFLLFYQFIFSQIDENNLYFKCGTLFGNKYELATACAKNVEKKYSKNFKKQDYKNQFDYCSCFLTLVAKNYTFEEANEVLKNHKNDFLLALLNNPNNKKIIDELKICGSYIGQDLKNDYDLSKDSDQFEEVIKKVCEYDFENTSNINKNKYNIDVYCECLSNELANKGLKISEFKDFKDSNSVLYNEIITKCINKSKIEINDVISENNFEYINLINNEKVKIEIGNISKYFIIDTGASNMSISGNLERELLLEGLIKKEDYLKDENYILANGSEIKCKMIKLNNVKIGSFIVHNVKIAIINNNDTDLLLGKSFLEKFNLWYIINNASKLYLEKK